MKKINLSITNRDAGPSPSTMSTNINPHQQEGTVPASNSRPWRNWTPEKRIKRLQGMVLYPQLTQTEATILLEDLTAPTHHFPGASPNLLKTAISYLQTRLSQNILLDIDPSRRPPGEVLPLPPPSPPPEQEELRIQKAVQSPTLTRAEALMLNAALCTDLKMFEKDPRRIFRGLSREMTEKFRTSLEDRLAKNGFDEDGEKQEDDGQEEEEDTDVEEGADEEEEETEEGAHGSDAETEDDEQDEEEEQSETGQVRSQGTKRKSHSVSPIASVGRDPKRRRTPVISPEPEGTDNEYSPSEGGYITDADSISSSDSDDDEPYYRANTGDNTPTPKGLTAIPRPIPQCAPSPPKQSPQYVLPLPFKFHLRADGTVEKFPTSETLPPQPLNPPTVEQGNMGQITRPQAFQNSTNTFTGSRPLNPRAAEWVSLRKDTTLPSPFTAQQVQSLAQQQLQIYPEQMQGSCYPPYEQQFPGVQRVQVIQSPPIPPQFTPQLPGQLQYQSTQLQTYYPQPQQYTPQAQQSPIQHFPLWHAAPQISPMVQAPVAPQFPQYQSTQSQPYSHQPQIYIPQVQHALIQNSPLWHGPPQISAQVPAQVPAPPTVGCRGRGRG
jgi:hypothetical protein